MWGKMGHKKLGQGHDKGTPRPGLEQERTPHPVLLVGPPGWLGDPGAVTPWVQPLPGWG